MKQQEVTFCDGCGKVFDPPEHEGKDGHWVELRDYETRYGFTWDDLVLSHTFCPDCLTCYSEKKATLPEKTTS